MNVSLCINEKFDETLRKQIEESLGRSNLFDIVYYYYNTIDNNTILFFRGGIASTSDYGRVLSQVFKKDTLTLECGKNNLAINVYKEGKIVFDIRIWQNAKKPFGQHLGFSLKKEDSIDSIFIPDEKKLKNLLAYHSNSVVFMETFLLDYLEILKLKELKPGIFWDYEKITKYDEKQKLQDLVEEGLNNIQKVAIKPILN